MYIYIYIHTRLSVKKKTPPEKKTLWKLSLKNTKSGAG